MTRNINSMEDLMEAIHMQYSASQGDNDTAPDRAVLIKRLREISALRSAVETFNPGDIVHHKFPAESNMRAADGPFVFVRYLEKPFDAKDFSENTKEVHTSTAAATLNCILGGLLSEKGEPGGSVYVEYIMDSKDFTLESASTGLNAAETD